MMEKMLDWLRENDIEECVMWWEKYWTLFHNSRSGAITLFDSGYASYTHQNMQGGMEYLQMPLFFWSKHDWKIN